MTISAGKDIFEDDTGIFDCWTFDNGTKHTLYVGMYGDPYYYSHAAIGFNLAGKLDDISVSSVQLILHCYDSSGDPVIQIFGSADDDWTESSSTTFPAASGNALTSEVVSGTYYASPDIKTYILSEYAGDQYATLLLESTATTPITGISPYAIEQSSTSGPYLEVTYTKPAATISTASDVTETNLNGMDVNLRLGDDTFSASLTTGMFTLNSDATANGVSIGNVTRVDDTHATLRLSCSSDIDEHFDLDVTLDGSALASGLSVCSNSINVHVYDEITAAGTYDLDDMGVKADIVVSTRGHVKLIHTSSSTSKRQYTITYTVNGADLEIDNINIDNSNYYNGLHCISFTGASNTLTITENSKLKAYDTPAVVVQSGTTLTIDGTGKLNASVSTDAAAIGAGGGEALGTIVIDGGTIKATGGSNAAGIGGGQNGAGGSVTVNGGDITAEGGSNGAGIGSGSGATAGIDSIEITGGTVTASGGNGDGAGIGGGETSTVGIITISGGTVTAGYSGGAGIGCGKSGTVSEINISDGVVYAKYGGTSDAAIGGDAYSTCSTINITGGRVYAEGYADNANDIGYGQYGSDSDGTLQVNIGGSSIVFLKNNLLSDRNDGISVPFYDDETIVDHTAYSIPVPDDWTGTAYAYISDSVPATGVSVLPETMRINASVNETAILTATVTPAYASDHSVSYQSSDESVATVDNDGIVTAVKKGTATVTGTSTSGGYTDTCDVTCYSGALSVSLSPSTQTLVLGDADTANDTVTLTATVSPDDAEDQSVTYMSTKTDVATVDASGVVTAVAAGETTITATTTDGGYTDTCDITVEQRVTSVGVSPTSATLTLDDGDITNDTVTLTETVYPADATDTRVTWESSDPAVATVDAVGVVTAVKKGTATITVKTVDGEFTADCAVTVSQRTTGVTVSPSTQTLVLGDADTTNDTVTLTTTVSPDDADDQSVTYASSDLAVATVDASGVVTAVAAGTATITVTTTDGGYTDTCDITVEQRVTGVSVSPSSATLVLGDGDSTNDTVTLTATVSPGDADNQDVIYLSSDPGVATVNASGVVTAVAEGKTTITVTTTDGGYTDTCAITVEQRATGVSVSPTSATLVLDDGNPANDTVTLTETVYPADATDTRVTWESSDPAIAAVDASGVVTAVKKGTATITVKTVDGGFTASCAVTVSQRTTGVTVLPSSATLVLDDADTANDTVTLTATVLPGDADDQSVTYTSSDPAVATVNASGVVTAVAAGTATITATTTDGGYTDTCDITVEQRATGVSVSPTSATLILDSGNPADNSVTLTETVYPADATDTRVTWESSDPGVAAVDASGVVTAVKRGTSTITVKTVDGGFTASCAVTVEQRATGLRLSPTASTLMIGDEDTTNDTVTLTATISPENANEQGVTYVSSDPCVATVDVYGIVTALKKGSAVITAITVDGSYTATCDITVEQQVRLCCSSPDGRVCMGCSITFSPSVGGGTWIYDPLYLANSGNTFTLLQAGTSIVVYSCAPSPGARLGPLDMLLNWLIPGASAQNTDSASYTVTAEALALEASLPSNSTPLKEDFTLTPNFDGGSWTFDSKYLAKNGDTFIPQRVGSTTIRYTYMKQTVDYELFIYELSPPTADGAPSLPLFAGLALLFMGLAFAWIRLRGRFLHGNLPGRSS